MLSYHYPLSKVFAVPACFALMVLFSMQPVKADSYDSASSFGPVYSPAINSQALRGLSAINSAESMGEGRITFSAFGPWYKQRSQFANTPNSGANIYTGTGAFSWGVNQFIDLFGSISGYAISNYQVNRDNSGLGTIQAGAQGSLPFPNNSFLMQTLGKREV